MNNQLDTLLKKSIDYAIFQNTDSNCQKQIGIAFRKGYEDCQKEYEEKLRWIPISELPHGECIVEDIFGQHSIHDFSGLDDVDIEWVIKTDKLVMWRSFL